MSRPGRFERRSASLLLAGFMLGGVALTAFLKPWDSLAWSTWPSGYEAGRIARNLSLGLGYDSPFLALPGDNFLSDPPDSEDPGLASPSPQESRPGIAPTAWVTPPYVLLWLLAFSLFGIYTPAAIAAFQIVQLALMTGSLAIAWRLVARLRGETTGLLALALLVLYPSSWYFAVGDTHGTSLFLAWLMGSLYTLERVVAKARGTWTVLHGLCVALAVLTEPVSLFFYLWLEAWAAFRLLRGRSGEPWRGGRLLAATAVAFAVIVGPWAIRNLLALQAPIPFKSNLPMELYYGNNEDSAWNIYAGHVRRFPAWNEEERLRLLAVGEPEYGRQCLLRAAMFLHDHPLTVLRLTAQRITYVWSYNPSRTGTWRPLLTLLFHLPLAVWLTALLLRPREVDWFDRICLAFFLLFPLLYYVTHLMIYRYRFPLEAILLLGAASAWGRLKGWSNPLEAPTAH